MASGKAGRDVQHVALERVQPSRLSEHLHDLAATRLGVCASHELRPVGGSIAHDGVGEIRGIVYDEPADVIAMEMAAHDDVDVRR